MYDAFFAWLDLSIENKPLSFSIDFEMAIMNSVQNIWPETILKGCYFHFRQNLWRQIQQLGFVTDYNNDEEAKKFFRWFAVLAFVPLDDVIKAYDLLLIMNKPLTAKFKTFVTYFETNYIGSKKRGRNGGRNEPRFPRIMWNVHLRTVNGEVRTSNNVEGWHNGVSFCHLRNGLNHILKIIDGLILEQQNTEHLLTRLNTGSVEHRRKKN